MFRIKKVTNRCNLQGFSFAIIYDNKQKQTYNLWGLYDTYAEAKKHKRKFELIIKSFIEEIKE